MNRPFLKLQADVEHFSHPFSSEHHSVSDPPTSRVHPRLTFVESLKMHVNFSEKKEKSSWLKNKIFMARKQTDHSF